MLIYISRKIWYTWHKVKMFTSRMFAFLLGFMMFHVAYGNLDVLHEKCIAETGIDKALASNANDGDFSDDGNFKCYLKCITVAVGVMNDAGEIVMTEESMKIFPEDQRDPIKNMVNKCEPQLAASDVCEKAFELHKCAYKVDPDEYKLI